MTAADLGTRIVLWALVAGAVAGLLARREQLRVEVARAGVLQRVARGGRAC